MAALVALIAIVGTIPYIALQLKAVSAMFGTLFMHVAPQFSPSVLGDTALLVALAMAAFAILFGTRHIDATEHQDGLMLAIAAESIVKLAAFLAVGLFDPDSPIRVRILHTGKPSKIDRAFWQARLDTSVLRRKRMFDERTTGYRLINGESDGWPGMVLDRYDRTLVLKIYTAAWLPALEERVGLIAASLSPQQIVLADHLGCEPSGLAVRIQSGAG